MTPVNSSPEGRGIPSTTVMEIIAWRGDSRVMAPSTTELEAGGCGRIRVIVRVYAITKKKITKAIPLSNRDKMTWRNVTNRTLMARNTDKTCPYLSIAKISSCSKLRNRTSRQSYRLAGQNEFGCHGRARNEARDNRRNPVIWFYLARTLLTCSPTRKILQVPTSMASIVAARIFTRRKSIIFNRKDRVSTAGHLQVSMSPHGEMRCRASTCLR